MPDAFDPYFKWLGIPAVDRPPHAYRLLGIELFESDADVISYAADGRMAQIKNFQAGKFGAVSQKLLNEIAAAKVCLLNPQKKAEYDRRLRAHLQQKSATANAQIGEARVAEASIAGEDSVAGLPFLDYSTTPTRSTTRPAKKAKQSAWLIPLGFCAAAIAFAAGVAVYLSYAGDGKGKPANPQTASLAGSDRLAPSKQSARSSDKLTAGTGEPSPKPIGSASAGAMEKPLVSLPPPRTDPTPPIPKPESSPKPKIELVDEPEKTAPAEKVPEKTMDNAGDNSTVPPPAAQKPLPPAPLPKGEGGEAKKPPIPDKEQYQAMKSKILKIFQKEVAEAKTPESKLALAEKLEQQGDASKDDPVERYALWRIAADGDSAAGEFSKVMDIVDKIQAQYDVDGDVLKADLLSSGVARTALAPEAARNLVETALKLAAAAVAREDFDAAARFAKLATNVARRAKDPQLSRDVLNRDREIEHLKTRFAVVAKALETLGQDADNAEANLAVGQWHCFAKGDWERGLPYLAKGGRKDLAELAKLELAKPAGGKEQVAVADTWWALAEKERTESKAICQARAVHWYEQAAPGLSGLEKIRVDKQIALARSGPAPEVRGRGVVQHGNVALTSNGTTVAGVDVHPELLLNGIPDQRDPCNSKIPCVITITFDKVYLLRQIRFHLHEGAAKTDADLINATYRLAVSRDGKNFELLQDHSKEPATGWQEALFAARPVKAVKAEALTSTNCNWFMLTQFEAYCYPQPAVAPAKKLR